LREWRKILWSEFDDVDIDCIAFVAVFVVGVSKTDLWWGIEWRNGSSLLMGLLIYSSSLFGTTHFGLSFSEYVKLDVLILKSINLPNPSLNQAKRSRAISNISAGPSSIMQIQDEYDCIKESFVHHFERKSMI